jgi:hypothetical protein
VRADLHPAESHRGGQRGEDPLGQRDGTGLVDVLADDDELVATEARDQVAGADGGPQPPGDPESSSSPAVWPRESLTTLKLSRSRKRQARPLAPGTNRSAT